MEQNWSPEINSQTYGQLVFLKGAKLIQWEKKKILQQIVLRHTLGFQMQNNEVRALFHTQLGWLSGKKREKTKCWWGCGETADGNVKWCTHYRKQFSGSSKS